MLLHLEQPQEMVKMVRENAHRETIVSIQDEY